MNVLSPIAAAIYDSINGALSPDQLDNFARSVWHHLSRGVLTDDEATFLSNAVEKRRPLRAVNLAAGVMVGKTAARMFSRFAPRACRRRLTDHERTKRRHRKRMLGGSAVMPDNIRHHYTEGERAVLCIVAGEVKRQGVCELSIDEIGDRAGVGRTTVQNAMHHARLLGHLEIKERPQRGAKNLTNVVRVISDEWLTWIKRGKSAARTIGSKSIENVNTSKTTKINIGGDGANLLARVPTGWHRRARRAMSGDSAPSQQQQAEGNSRPKL
ncbi:hypothetical protein [Bradyrhizobium arachidis]|uniref:hypothetical protein n=1 Tax=Bradyrhizobium arachidis TaxID=858423 RepID=UPI002162660D|nr:hypothetical protein [Bradyrhizobium arachidis]UVO27031.1 hypothetical protein KUF59_31525 [Bradyrhizobium arachidis]